MTGSNGTDHAGYEDGMDWQIPDLDDGLPEAPPSKVDWDSPSMKRFLASFTGLDTIARPIVRKPAARPSKLSTSFTESFMN